MEGNVKDFQTLEATVRKIAERKADYRLSASKYAMTTDNQLNGFDVLPFAQGQIAERFGIPKKYYDSMGQIEGLRSVNVNSWLQKDPDEKWLVRTLDQKVRAFLSAVYRPIDNDFILDAFMPVLRDAGEIQVKACTLTDIMMYVQIVFPRIQGEVVPGDVVQAGVTMTNSEVGRSSVNVEEMIWRLRCKNGAVGESVLRKYHVGRRVGDDSEDYDFFQDDTILAELDSFKKRLRDTLAHTLTQAYFDDRLARMRMAAADAIVIPVPKVVLNVQKRFGFTDTESENILVNTAVEGAGNPTRWSLINGITALAHDASPDRQYDVERIGHEVLLLTDRQWQDISAA